MKMSFDPHNKNIFFADRSQFVNAPESADRGRNMSIKQKIKENFPS